MRLLKWGGGLLLAAALGAALAGCSGDNPNSGGKMDSSTGGDKMTTSNGGDKTTPTTGGSGTMKIAVIPKGAAHQFWQAVKAGAEAAGQEEKVDIIWQPPTPEDDVVGQINDVETQVNNKVNGIVLAAVDATALVNPVKKAIGQGISVVTIDSGIKEDITSAYIATDNVKGGMAAADALAKEIGEKGDVGLLIFGKGSVSSDEREKGFVEGIKKYPNIKLVSTLEANDATKAVNAATNMLTANPKITGIFAANEPNGVGTAQVLKQQKKNGQIKVVAYDSSDKELAALEDGTIQALIVQDPYQMGYLGVKTVLKAIKKEPIDKKVIDSGMTVVTKANLQTPEVQKLVNPAKK